jgi:hypothetical protein
MKGKQTVYELIVMRETKEGCDTKSWGFWQDEADLKSFASRQFEYDERFSWVIKPKTCGFAKFKAAHAPWAPSDLDA